MILRHFVCSYVLLYLLDIFYCFKGLFILRSQNATWLIGLFPIMWYGRGCK